MRQQEEQLNTMDSSDSACSVDNGHLAEVVKDLAGLKLMLPGRLLRKKWHLKFRRICS